ncbi:MAG: NAD(P)-dependent oxidoreductase [Rikenellaceae bacterium]
MKIVFLDQYSISSCDLTELQSLGEYRGYELTATAKEVVERAADAEVIISNKVVLDEEIISQLPHLKLICVAATGMNNIDLDAALKFGIEVRNAVGYSTHSVAEATLSSALALYRQVSYFDRYFKSGNYSRSEKLFIFDRPIHQLHGKKWGIIGLGNIGREVARLAIAFGCEVAYTSTSGVTRDELYEKKSLKELLSWADVISLHSPLNNQTKGLIGASEFAQMKHSAIIINVSRGGIIDEDALADALNNNIITGAAIDVFRNEPIEPSSKLLTLNDPDRLLSSTHNAWAAEEAIEALVWSIIKNIREVMM